MPKVSYKQGTRAQYDAILSKDPYALYWCTDSRELFKGEDLYTDGVRFVDNKESLPEFSVAAEGKIYFCTDNGSGYVLNTARNGWINILHGVDGTTIKINEEGLYEVIGGGSAAPDLTEELAELTQRVTDLETIVAGGTEFKGQVDNVDALPQEGNKPGDIYQTTDDNKQYIWDGDEWREYGSSLTLTNDLINTDQFEILEGKLNLKEVKGEDIKVPSGEEGEEQSLNEALESINAKYGTLNSTVEQHTTDIAEIQSALEWEDME